MGIFAFAFAAFLLGLFAMVSPPTAMARENLTIASVDRHFDALSRNFTAIPKKHDLATQVCGAGSGYPSMVCSDNAVCCFANRGFYFCCKAGTQCGGDGNCY
jgi:hypothetical protein